MGQVTYMIVCVRLHDVVGCSNAFRNVLHMHVGWCIESENIMVHIMIYVVHVYLFSFT